METQEKTGETVATATGRERPIQSPISEGSNSKEKAAPRDAAMSSDPGDQLTQNVANLVERDASSKMNTKPIEKGYEAMNEDLARRKEVSDWDIASEPLR